MTISSAPPTASADPPVDLEKGAAGRPKAAATTEEEEEEELVVVDPCKAMYIKATLVILLFSQSSLLLLHVMLFVIEFHAYSLLKTN